MDRRSKIILGIFAAVLLGIIITEIVRPKPLDWRPSYMAEAKVPFGCFVLYNELPKLFPNIGITKVEETIYNIIGRRDSTTKSNYLVINDHVSLDRQEAHQLLSYVSQGHSVFISAGEIGAFLRDTLNLNLGYEYSFREDTVLIDLTHNNFKGRSFPYSRGMGKTYITSIDSTNTTILGHLEYTMRREFPEKVEEVVKKPNFIETLFGKGKLYIHTNPEVFSNYYLLKGNETYVAHVFSYLDNSPLYWDNYKKSGRKVIDSPMRFVLNQTALKWAYYLTVTVLVLFVVFRAKREQRIIPVIKQKENSSVEFTRTIGALYYQNKDYTDLIHKKLRYFLAYIRNTYYLDTSKLDEKTMQQMAFKSNKSVEEVKKLFDYILYLKGKPTHTEKDTIDLSKKINAFKQ